MAKLYDKKKHEILWSDCDIACLVEEAYWELSDFIAVKRLDGHDRTDQWYIAMHSKLNELIEVMGKCPIDETNPYIQEIL